MLMLLVASIKASEACFRNTPSKPQEDIEIVTC